MARRKVKSTGTKRKTEIQELSEFIRDHMVTKGYLNERLAPIIENQSAHTKTLAEIKRDLAGVRKEVERLSEKLRNVEGYGKEINHAFTRIAAIEKHLGLRATKR